MNKKGEFGTPPCFQVFTRAWLFHSYVNRQGEGVLFSVFPGLTVAEFNSCRTGTLRLKHPDISSGSAHQFRIRGNIIVGFLRNNRRVAYFSVSPLITGGRIGPQSYGQRVGFAKFDILDDIVLRGKILQGELNRASSSSAPGRQQGQQQYGDHAKDN